MALSLPSDPKQKQQVYLTILPIMLVLLYWNFMHRPKKAEIVTLETQLEQIEQNNRVVQRQVREGQDISKKLALYEQHRILLEQLIPTSDEVPELLHAMTLRAQEAGVELALMRPEPEAPTGSYTRQTYEMAVVGTYHAVGRFLADIGSLPRIVTPIQLKLEARRQPARTEREPGAPPLVEASFRIQTYIQPKPGETPPPATRSNNART